MSFMSLSRSIFTTLKTYSKNLITRLYSSEMSKTACVIVANGSEEMESVITIDVLRRGGIATTVAGIQSACVVTCSREVLLQPDTSLAQAIKEKNFDVIVLPGGLGGAKAFAESALVGQLLKEQEKNNRWIAAICAAPIALKAHGVGCGKKVTSYPSMAEEMKDGNQYEYVDDKQVVVDGKLITSRGPATAIPFALTIVQQLVDDTKAKEVAKGMLYVSHCD